MDSDCVYLNCVSGVCVVPSKTCPGTDCSGNGACLFQDTQGSTVAVCLASDLYCTAVCACQRGYGGADCSLDPTTVAVREDARVLMCQTLLDTISISDPSSSLLNSLATSIEQVFNQYEVQSLYGVGVCYELFLSITKLARDGYLQGATSSTMTVLARVLSSFASVVSTSSITPSIKDSLQSIGIDLSATSRNVMYSILSTLSGGTLVVHYTTQCIRH